MFMSAGAVNENILSFERQKALLFTAVLVPK
jgi:hypothetical protein